jgi:hypothetical protein
VPATPVKLLGQEQTVPPPTLTLGPVVPAELEKICELMIETAP